MTDQSLLQSGGSPGVGIVQPGMVFRDWTIERFLGSGSFGTVWAASRRRLDGLQRAALKVLYPGLNAETRASLVREFTLLSSIRHPSLLSYLDAFEQEDGPARGSVVFVLELADQDLREYLLRSCAVGMDEESAKFAFSSLADGLAAFHDTNHVHGDIKPANIVRVGDKWKLADFGLSAPLDGSHVKADAATIDYCAPEDMANDDLVRRRSSDIWAMGITFHEALTGRHPVPGADVRTRLLNITRGIVELHESLSPTTRAVLERCLQMDHRTRITARDLSSILRSTSLVLRSAPPPQPVQFLNSAISAVSAAAPAAPAPGLGASAMGLGASAYTAQPQLAPQQLAPQHYSPQPHAPQAFPAQTFPPQHHVERRADQLSTAQFAVAVSTKTSTTGWQKPAIAGVALLSVLAIGFGLKSTVFSSDQKKASELLPEFVEPVATGSGGNPIAAQTAVPGQEAAASSNSPSADSAQATAPDNLPTTAYTSEGTDPNSISLPTDLIASVWADPSAASQQDLFANSADNLPSASAATAPGELGHLKDNKSFEFFLPSNWTGWNTALSESDYSYKVYEPEGVDLDTSILYSTETFWDGLAKRMQSDWAGQSNRGTLYEMRKFTLPSATGGVVRYLDGYGSIVTTIYLYPNGGTSTGIEDGAAIEIVTKGVVAGSVNESAVLAALQRFKVFKRGAQSTLA